MWSRKESTDVLSDFIKSFLKSLYVATFLTDLRNFNRDDRVLDFPTEFGLWLEQFTLFPLKELAMESAMDTLEAQELDLEMLSLWPLLEMLSLWPLLDDV